ncbi:ribonuclease Z [Flavobacterium sp. H122]|uniref:ribonuclease Z n=1 Tax=Flavobacterium sp. H122 TaxID=2529860 RepID=UPI0010AA5877|nr:ribonuclease Z [Flavobacterium sp. H122]
MKVDQKGHTTIIKDTEGNSDLFLNKVTEQYNTFKNSNLILDITHDKSVNIDAIKAFTDLSKKHTKAKKSLIIVADGIDFNDVPHSLHVVPTVLEAHDMIEMEEIERDLGF